MKEILDYPLVLKEAAVVEQLRRSEKIQLHPTLVNAPLIYNEDSSAILRSIYQSYIQVAATAQVPFLMCTPTWRCNEERVKASHLPKSINRDAVRFLKALKEAQNLSVQQQVYIGGLIGCKNDCYLPEQGLNLADAERFHSWQINELAEAGVDFLIAETLPNVQEATGIALTMEKTGLPYIINFVINRKGLILDGSTIEAAINQVDQQTTGRPLGYQINCAYPSFLCADKQPEIIFERLIGYQGNGSALDQCDLDGADELQAESVEDWGNAMLELNHKYGVKILGGCCGTGVEHLQYLMQHN